MTSFLTYAFILNIHCSSSFLSIFLFTAFFFIVCQSSFTWRRRIVESACVLLFPCLIGKYIFLDLFRFVNLASSCPLIPRAIVLGVIRLVSMNDSVAACFPRGKRPQFPSGWNKQSEQWNVHKNAQLPHRFAFALRLLLPVSSLRPC